MTISFGALAPPLKDQVGFDNAQIRTLQKCVESATLLLVQGYLTRTEICKVETRIVKGLEKAIKENQGEEA
jgi:hypothetical protein